MIQPSPYILPLAISAIITGSLGIYAWQRRRTATGAAPFAAMMFAAAVWALGDAATWASPDPAVQYFCRRVTFMGVVVVPVAWFVFAVKYTGRGRWLTRQRLPFFLIIPAITVLLVWTNHLHLLFWRTLEAATVDGINLLIGNYGPWFWIHSAYSYGLLLVGMALLLLALARNPRKYRGRMAGLLVGVLAPLVINALFLTGLIPIPNLDPTPITFAISGIAFGWTIFSYSLLDVIPAAHEAVIRSLDDLVIVLNAENYIVDINGAALRVIGKTQKEVIGVRGYKILAQWPELVEEFRFAEQGEKEIYLPVSGGRRPFMLQIATLRDRWGEPMGRLIHLTDITQRKRTEAALEQSERDLYAIVEAMDDPYFEADLKGAITYANQAFVDNLHYASKDEVIGRNFRRFTERSYVRQIYDYFNQIYTTRQPLKQFQYRYLRSDDTVGYGEISASIIFDKDGNPVGTRGMIRDATERFEREQALQKAKQAAEEVSQAKSSFLANVSHELRTPLTSVLGFARLSQKKLVEQVFPRIPAPDAKTVRAMKQIEENLNIIVTESQRLTHLINDVLDLSKIEAGKVEWHMAPISVVDVMDRAIAATSSLFDQKGVRLIRNVPPTLPEIVGDHDKLIQVVINLISNAVKFTDQGSVACRADQVGDEIVVRITDTGVGIAPEDQPKVFELFMQVGDTLTDKPKGTGLGLAICKQIIEHHGGRIWVESDGLPGRGSTFAFIVPIFKRPDWRKPAVFDLESFLNRPPRLVLESTSKQILVVDDEMHVRQLLRQELETSGHTVLEAGDAAAALEIIATNPPDLIILDLLMPGRTGFDVAVALKSDPATANIPLIVLSVVELLKTVTALGVDRYLTKPIDSKELLRDVEMLLANDVAKHTMLLAEDDPAIAARLAAALEGQGYAVETAATADVLKRAQTVNPESVVVSAVAAVQLDLIERLRATNGLEKVSVFLFEDGQQERRL